MSIDTILFRLQKVRKNGANKWVACCPAHEDKSPSLGIQETSDGRILLKCFSGCSVPEILYSIELKWADLFPEDMNAKTLCRDRPDWFARKHRKEVKDRIINEIVLDWYIQDIKNGKRFTPEENAKYLASFKEIRKEAP